MYCPMCLRKQKGFDYLFTERFNVCYECMCYEAVGVDENVAKEMANEVLKEFDNVTVRYPLI